MRRVVVHRALLFTVHTNTERLTCPACPARGGVRARGGTLSTADTTCYRLVDLKKHTYPVRGVGTRQSHDLQCRPPMPGALQSSRFGPSAIHHTPLPSRASLLPRHSLSIMPHGTMREVGAPGAPAQPTAVAAPLAASADSTHTGPAPNDASSPPPPPPPPRALWARPQNSGSDPSGLPSGLPRGGSPPLPSPLPEGAGAMAAGDTAEGDASPGAG